MTWTPFETYVRNNITATERLLEAVRDEAALRLFVNVATSSVYGADAVAGVVNFILDTDFSGVRGGINFAGFHHNNNNQQAQQMNEDAVISLNRS